VYRASDLTRRPVVRDDGHRGDLRSLAWTGNSARRSEPLDPQAGAPNASADAARRSGDRQLHARDVGGTPDPRGGSPPAAGARARQKERRDGRPCVARSRVEQRGARRDGGARQDGGASREGGIREGGRATPMDGRKPEARSPCADDDAGHRRLASQALSGHAPSAAPRAPSAPAGLSARSRRLLPPSAPTGAESPHPFCDREDSDRLAEPPIAAPRAPPISVVASPVRTRGGAWGDERDARAWCTMQP